MREAPTGKTAHVDTFVRDRLPKPEHWPTLLYDLYELDYAPQTNVVTELLTATSLRAPGADPCCGWSPAIGLMRSSEKKRIASRGC